MASQQEASSSNSSNSNSTPRTWTYDVFLSFRGEDARACFTDHLRHALKGSGFRIFRDDEELERGEVISQKLKQAIKDCHCAVVVLSENYASSSWCLDELQHMLDSCQQVFPIFNNVDPYDVRHQRRSFAQAFDMHQMLQRDNIESWRNSLKQVAAIFGWHCKKDQAEALLIEMVVQEMWTRLRYGMPHGSEELLGVENKVEKLESLLEMGLNDVRFMGIWGLGGVGKTTIAWAIFEKYRSQFEISCFLHNVRPHLERDDVVDLQSQLLSLLNIRKVENHLEGNKIIESCFRNKRVLLIPDDVNHTSHLENFANSPDWFGAGSRVIITTRNSRVLCKLPAKCV